MTRLGHMLRLYMQISNISCREVARSVKISAATVSRICNGKQPDAQTLIKLLDWMVRDK